MTESTATIMVPVETLIIVEMVLGLQCLVVVLFVFEKIFSHKNSVRGDVAGCNGPGKVVRDPLYYKFEITCQKYRRKIIPTSFAALTTVPFGTRYIHAWYTTGIPQELNAAKADKRCTNL